MRDTYRRATAIQQAIMQCYQPCPTGHRERHLHTLVALIGGVAGGQRAPLATPPITRPVVRLIKQVLSHASSAGATMPRTRWLGGSCPWRKRCWNNSLTSRSC